MYVNVFLTMLNYLQYTLKCNKVKYMNVFSVGPSHTSQWILYICAGNKRICQLRNKELSHQIRKVIQILVHSSRPNSSVPITCIMFALIFRLFCICQTSWPVYTCRCIVFLHFRVLILGSTTFLSRSLCPDNPLF